MYLSWRTSHGVPLIDVHIMGELTPIVAITGIAVERVEKDV